MKRRTCEACGKPLAFRYAIIREGVYMAVGQECLRRGDLIRTGRGKTVEWNYQ